MSERLSIGGALQQAFRDRTLLTMLAILFVSLIPLFLPGLDYDWLWNYNMGLTVVAVLPACVILLWPSRNEQLSIDERVFWRLFAAAFAVWWLVTLAQWQLADEHWTRLTYMLADVAYLAFYVLIFVALAVVANRGENDSGAVSLRRVRATGLILLAFWLYCYFALIPGYFQEEFYDSTGFSLVFITLLDLILALWLFALARTAQSNRWRLLYQLLFVSAVCGFAVDVLETWYYFEAPSWMDSWASESIWFLPFACALVYARARRLIPADSQQAAEVELSLGPVHTSPIILLAFVLPVAHLLTEILGGPAPAEAHYLQGTVVLGSIVTFWVLAISENRTLKKITEIAERNAQEIRQMRMAQEVARKSEQAKARFLANVSHELRTPMNGILGMSELLLTSNLDDTQRRRAELLKTSSVSLTHVINDILDYSKAESGALRIEATPFSLEQVAQQTLDLMQVAAKEKRLELELTLEDSLPKWLIGDATRLQQVLINFVSNAIKFSDEGPIRLRFSQLKSSEGVVTVRGEVIDKGRGFDPEQADYIFLPFTQGDETSTRKHGGSGLGLAITRQLTELMGGAIGASNNPDEGSTFWFEIPFAIGKPVLESAREESRQHEAARRDAHILLVEDDLTSRLVIAAQVQSLGYQIDVVTNGAEALQAIAVRNYTMILMDCDMPVMDGLEATRHIRTLEQEGSNTALPVVALTAHVFDDNRADCEAAGMSDFLDKPLELERLKKTLEKWTPPLESPSIDISP